MKVNIQGWTDIIAVANVVKFAELNEMRDRITIKSDVMKFAIGVVERSVEKEKRFKTKIEAQSYLVSNGLEFGKDQRRFDDEKAEFPEARGVRRKEQSDRIKELGLESELEKALAQAEKDGLL